MSYFLEFWKKYKKTMQDKFITNEGIEIPLDGLSFSFTEENPRFKDSFWTNYTLPIELSLYGGIP